MKKSDCCKEIEEIKKELFNNKRNDVWNQIISEEKYVFKENSYNYEREENVFWSINYRKYNDSFTITRTSLKKDSLEPEERSISAHKDVFLKCFKDHYHVSTLVKFTIVGLLIGFITGLFL